MPEKNEKHLESVESVRWVVEGRRNTEEKICGKDWVLSLLWKWGVMDGDSGDEGNDELTCVRSDESDTSSWSVGRRSSLGSWFQRQGDAWRKEWLLTFREEEEDGRERVMISDERVLRWGWREIRLYRYDGWVVVRTLYVREIIL